MHDIKQLNFRITSANLIWVKQQAEKHRRSLTSQMNWIIEEAKRQEHSQQQAA